MAKAPDIAEEDINTMFSTNVNGLINMTQAVLPIFKRRSNGGAGDIINIGSIAGREAYAGGSIYCATKAAVRSFTDSLRKELIATRIRVLEIDPGQVETVGSLLSREILYGWFRNGTLISIRSSHSCGSTETRPKRTLSTREYCLAV